MIPRATTKITIKRVLSTGMTDPYEPDPNDVSKDAWDVATDVVKDVPANIQPPSIRGTGRLMAEGGQKERRSMFLVCDPIKDGNPVDLRHTDYVLDQGTGEMYEVDWVASAHDLFPSMGGGARRFHDYLQAMITFVGGVSGTV